MMRRIHGRFFDFHPEGFILPGERDAFVRYVTNEMSQVNTRIQSADNNSTRRPSSAVLKIRNQINKMQDDNLKKEINRMALLVVKYVQSKDLCTLLFV